MFGKQQEHLKIFSFKTMQEKMLPQDAFCRFTVDPQYTQLYLPELLKYVDDPIPSSAKFFLDYDSGDPLPDLLVSGVVQLEKVEIGKLLSYSIYPRITLAQSVKCLADWDIGARWVGCVCVC